MNKKFKESPVQVVYQDVESNNPKLAADINNKQNL
jgi:hypothetical protein